MAELEHSLTHAEWVEWLALYRFDPWDDDRRDYMFAQHTALTWNLNVDKEHRKGPGAFLPHLATRKASQPPQPENAPSLRERFLGLARMSKRAHTRK